MKGGLEEVYVLNSPWGLSMDRGNHYETAFAEYLHWHHICHVPVDESRRCVLGEESIKSLDFIVYGNDGTGLLVDIKGRRYPGGTSERPRRVWESWSTREDIVGLQRWNKLFGPRYIALLVFMYHLQDPCPPLRDEEDLWTWRDRRYVLRAVPVADYVPCMRTRSPRWGTVCLPTADMARLARPFYHFLGTQRSRAVLNM